MDWRNISTLLPGTTYYLGLHRPTIKGLLWTNITSGWIIKAAVDCNRGLYIHSEYD